MTIHYCKSVFCGRPFQVNEFDARFGDFSSAGRIICPHCGMVACGSDTSVFITHALLGEEEARGGKLHVLGNTRSV